VSLSQSTGPDGSTTVAYKAIPEIKLRELQDDEYRTLITTGGYIEHQALPLSGEYLTALELHRLNLKNVNVKIYPAGGGDCCWEIENDQTNEGAPLQIWERDVNQVYRMLVPVDSIDTTGVFYLYNPVLTRYATSGLLIGDGVSASSSPGAAQQFRIMRSQDYSEPYFAFIPVQAQNCGIICQDGNLGNSTKLLLGALTSVNPMWALWRITAVNA
jgi:hypothetical protein